MQPCSDGFRRPSEESKSETWVRVRVDALKKSEKFGYPRLIGFLMFNGHFCSFFVPFGNYSSRSTHLKEYWLKPIAFSGIWFWTYYIQNPKLSDRLRHTSKFFLVPVHHVQVSKTWRILGSLFLSRRKFSTPWLAKKHLQMALRPLLKGMTAITNLRYWNSRQIL